MVVIIALSYAGAYQLNDTKLQGHLFASIKRYTIHILVVSLMMEVGEIKDTGCLQIYQEYAGLLHELNVNNNDNTPE